MASDAAEWTEEQVREAAAVVHAHVAPTPLRHSLYLSHRLGATVLLKMEMLHESQSFKLRGAIAALELYRRQHGSLPPAVVAASGGNHGQAVALACKMLETARCVIFLPHNSARPAITAFLADYCGAEVQVRGDDFAECNGFATTFAAGVPGALYLHPYDDEHVMRGQGTIMSELADQLGGEGADAPPDIVIGSMGGGGMLSGLLRARAVLQRTHQHFSPQVMAVQTEGCSWYAASLEQGAVARKPVTSIAKTLGSSTSTPAIFERFRALLDRYFVVSDADTVRAMETVLEHEKLLVEPSAACVVAAMLREPEVFAGKRVVVVLCGCNVNPGQLEEWKATLL